MSKRTSVSLTKSETEAIGSLMLILAVCAGIIFAIVRLRTSFESQSRDLLIQADTITNSYRGELDKCSELEAAKNKIASTWVTMKRWFPGPTQSTDFGMFKSIGAAVSEPAPETKPHSGVTVTFFKISSNKAEYHRFLTTLNTAEEKYGYLQLYRLTMKLPKNVQPMSTDPTFLEIDTYFSHPQVKPSESGS